MTLFFDLDGTLCRVRNSREKILEKCLTDYGLEDVDRYDYLEAHQSVLSEGKVKDRVPVFRELLENNDVFDEDLAEELAFSYNDKVLSNLELYDDASVLDDVDDKLVLITNGPKRSQEQKIYELELDEVFDEVIISGEVGFAKPDPLIFKVAYARAGEKGPYVGNSPQHDVLGCKGAGFLSVLVDRGIDGDYCDPDFVVDSLFELRDILDM